MLDAELVAEEFALGDDTGELEEAEGELEAAGGFAGLEALGSIETTELEQPTIDRAIAATANAVLKVFSI